LQSLYGNRMDQMWGQADPADLRQAWAEELGGYSGEDIGSALADLRAAHPDYPPTLYQFANLCRDARARRTQTVVKIAVPRTPMPEDVRRKLAEFTKRVTRAA